MTKKLVPTCRPKTYGVGNTHGWKCPTHHILTKRYKSRELRDQRMAEHVAEFSKKQKKS